MLTNDKTKLDNEIKQLKIDNQTLKDQLKEALPPPPLPTTTTTTTTPRKGNKILFKILFSFLERVPDEFIKLVEKAVAENGELKNVLAERDNEIQVLKEQLNKIQSEDPQLVEQRLLQLVSKLKNDFGKMYENQSNFFLQKVDFLKQEQRDNIASLYKH